MNEVTQELGQRVAKKLAGLDLAQRAVMTNHTARIASQVRRGARWQQEAWLRAGCGAPPEEVEATEGEPASASDDEEAGEMFHVGDITNTYNFPSETKERIEKTHTTDAAAVATAVEKVAGSPLGKWGRRLLYTAVGTSLVGQAVSVPLSIYGALREPGATTVNVPAAADTDTDTAIEYQLRLRPNPQPAGGS